ncbi:MAG: hypothetical protein CMD35_00815 [Flavobacteriales bacterium]|nr:hypothetical protein [Flavobacteriales bacterium]|tara:strand:- start:1235 stop:1858 length:624 start_codon:yes stop_codon:yes gene_type:complete
MNIKLLTLLSASLFIFSSCEKDEDTSISTSTSTSTEDYLPLNIGNNWSYTGAIAYETFINSDTTIGGKLYYKIENDQGASNLIRKSGSDYLIIDEAVYGDNEPHVILKEKGNEGDEWGFDISVNTYGFITKNVYKFTIHEKLESLEVNNNLFEDVLVIDLDIETYLDGDYIMSTNDYRYYYANGIGLIKSGSALFGGYSDLVEYTVQ